jgi:hypothetical protein
MAITVGQIESAQVNTRKLSEAQVAALKPLAIYLGDWQRMDFTTQDDGYRRDCRLSAYAGNGEELADGLLEGKIGETVERMIDELDPRDRKRFREAFADEIAAIKAL